ncbi:MAG: NUDIX domain-containing protein [Christensenellales bacterium]
MIFRKCAGGIVFYDDSVLLLKNEKNEWVLPKGVVRDRRQLQEVAVSRVETEAGVKEPQIIAMIGETCYEFYSVTRGRPVCNEVVWFLMTTKEAACRASSKDGFDEAGFFPYNDAVAKVTYSQDKALIRLAHKKLAQFKA